MKLLITIGFLNIIYVIGSEQLETKVTPVFHLMKARSVRIYTTSAGSDNYDYAGSDNYDYAGSDNYDYAGSDNYDYAGSDNYDYAGSDNYDIDGTCTVTETIGGGASPEPESDVTVTSTSYITVRRLQTDTIPINFPVTGGHLRKPRSSSPSDSSHCTATVTFCGGAAHAPESAVTVISYVTLTNVITETLSPNWGVHLNKPRSSSSYDSIRCTTTVTYNVYATVAHNARFTQTHWISQTVDYDY